MANNISLNSHLNSIGDNVSKILEAFIIIMDLIILLVALMLYLILQNIINVIIFFNNLYFVLSSINTIYFIFISDYIVLVISKILNQGEIILICFNILMKHKIINNLVIFSIVENNGRSQKENLMPWNSQEIFYTMDVRCQIISKRKMFIIHNN